jgi:hypothetical protein
MSKLIYFKTMAVIVLFIFFSCASIITGPNRSVSFDSNPSGAMVFVNGLEKGFTPTQFRVKSGDVVTFKLENYEGKKVVVDSKFNIIAVLNTINIISWGVDYLTGSLKRVHIKNLNVNFENMDNDSINSSLQDELYNDVGLKHIKIR